MLVNADLFFPDNKTKDIFTITHISNMNNQHKNITGLLRVIAKITRKNH